MPDDPIPQLRKRYAEAYATHGESPKALLYHSPGSQTDRFAILSKVADYEGHSVLDVGCGLGDLYPYLKQRHGAFAYTGLEIVPETCTAAARRFPDAEFINGTLDVVDAERDWDFVVESGIFNTSEYQWPAMEAVVRAMWARCRVATICNFLSRLSTGQSNADSAYYDAGDVLKLAAKLTRRFSLLHTYRDNDFTLILFRDPRHPGTDDTPMLPPEGLVRRP
jgi:SAM-dependent methyltransferase